MQLTMKVAKVVRRTETVEARGEAPTPQVFEDVSLDSIAGEPFLGSATGGMHFTVDNPALQGRLREGATVVVTLT